MAGLVVVTLGVLLACLPPCPLAQRPPRQQSWRQGYSFLDDLEVKGQGLKELEPRGWQLTPDFRGLRLANQEARRFAKRFWGDFTFSLKASFSRDWSPRLPVSLFSVHSDTRGLPALDLQVWGGKGGVSLRYLGERSYQRVRINKALWGWAWHSLLVKVNNTAVSVRVDCGDEVTVTLRQKPAQLDLASSVWLGRPTEGVDTLQGILFEATVYPRNMQTERLCDEGLAADQPAALQDDAPGGALAERVSALEQQLARVTSVLESLTTENVDLKRRIAFRETCECRPRCAHNGVVYKEGDTWNQGLCAVCQCLNGQPVCSTRDDVPSCVDQCPPGVCQGEDCTPVIDVTLPEGGCLAPPCLGPAQVVDPGVTGQQCLGQVCVDGSCPSPQNPCVWRPDPGPCNQTLLRFYYDRTLQECREFNYSGCGGNVNNYVTLRECEEGTMVGACCFRSFSTDLQTLLHTTQDIRSECQELHLFECRAKHRQPHPTQETEVVSFQPRGGCQDSGCLTQDVCFTVDRSYRVGDVFRLGCQNCTCLAGGQVDCTCVQVSRRRELRDLSREELIRFQYAVSRLRISNGNDTWSALRDLYMQHAMHATGGVFFLPWHRYFLRLVEQQLQEIDCEVTLPYFDFTTDVGDLSRALLWQPNFFGGDGEGRDHCVPDHPFGAPSSWQPCLMRSFNSSVRLPTLVELSLALASEDFLELSLCLETYLAYLHAYIGGDMATTASPYDPAFLALHAFADMLYWRWQQQRDARQFQFPAAFGNIPMVPFNTMPWMVFDLSALCVTYELPSKGHECNTTQRVMPARPTIQRGDIDPEVVYVNRGFDQFGYDKEGFDRLSFDRFGFDREGYNRDGYNRSGFDRTGFNRYDLDVEGYDRLGFDISGRDRGGNLDTSGRFDDRGYNSRCLNRQGLTVEGFDQYGFNRRGYDADNCNYFFRGPWATLRSHRVLETLLLQDKAFLMSLPRLCPPLSPLPTRWLEQHWITNIKDVTGMVPVQETPGLTGMNARFCFDLDPFLDLCPCREGTARCTGNPCVTSTCPSFPRAQCRLSLCGQCRPRWFLDNMEVDCEAERDFCQPNPCQHGGTCLASIWPSEPSLVTCQCPPGFEGHLCQHRAVDTCTQPLVTGNCGQQLRRWFYNHRTQSCQEFVYTGCQGNANNFPSINSCQAACVIGACCYRQPANRRLLIGYDRDGFDRYGFDVEGYSDLANRQTPATALKSSSGRFNQEGYDWQGYDRSGYNRQGYDRYGYDRRGYDREGFNLTGFSRLGEYDGIIDYDQDGFDAEGFNRAGYNCQGVDREGRSAYGVSVAFTYQCRPMTFAKCQSSEASEGVEVVRFSPGKRCEEVECGDRCGCSFQNRTYLWRATFRAGCQSCTCTAGGVVVCACDVSVTRKAVHDMTRQELQRFQRAVRVLQTETGFPSQWFNFSALYAAHKPQAVGSDAFLPWNRYFLHQVEQALREVDCDVFIPYYDWTLDAGQPSKAVIWAANMFGGNGQNLTECVQYHPFKSYFPPYWTPCLRRQFNLSISLPDAVTVQQALNEPGYTNFRVRMELFAKLFQTFVGGHMASDLSAYDPLYYALLANIDKLWYEWQLKSVDAILNYPAVKRFLPMEPFKATPDDVLDSRLLLCVTYLPLSRGSPCNITEVRTLGYDEEGYDRHGYNRQGYDSDGFNVIGVDAQGNVDQRGIYNARGFDRYGFGRDGYDQTGFDRYGYHVDSYNVDGFDAEGYDRSGFDRYGFNRSGITIFGFHRNGSFVPGVRESDLTIFDPYGYNKYGYDKFGFDREGYDVFGFNKFGYNSQVCNYYHIGPMYVLFKHYIDDKLSRIDDDLLTKIRRVCPEITNVPDWQIVTNWLNRDNQIVLIDMIETQQNQRVQSINGSITMQMGFRKEFDERLCFVTQMFTECELGVMPVLCVEDLCQGRSCPGHPTAVCRTSGCGYCHHEFYDGLTGNSINCTGCVDVFGQERQNGEKWRKSMCEDCACVEGMVVCREVQCPQPDCPHPVKLEDQCCPRCDGCGYEGRVFASGVSFLSPRDPCSRCQCARGEVRCQAILCPALDACQSVALTPGQCCPACLDCGPHPNASTWKPNPCQTCRCLNGRAVCEETVCRAPNCDHPYTPEDDCCPVCVACFYQGRIYQDGEQFQVEACQRCRCRQGNVECVRDPCPPVTCDRPVTPPGQCCPVCDSDCDYDMQRYAHNSVFTPSYNPCLNCSCVNSMVRCSAVRCPQSQLSCARPARRRGECCPSYCPTCSAEGREYQEGDTWSPQGQPCVTCTCREGSATCRRQDTCALECTHGVDVPGSCCSPCTDCQFEGRVVPDGSSFLRQGPQCQQCSCRRGNLQCQLMGPCPVLPCTRTLPPAPGSCCPSCLGCEIEGRSYKYGELVSQDACSRCVCREGQLDCERVPCPPLQCSDPQEVEGQCCPLCTTCDFLGRTYQTGQSFTSPRDPCDMCICLEGQVQCRSRQAECPPTPCTHPGRETGRCCPRCQDCEYRRRSLGNGQKFMEPGGDPCQVCTCTDGSVTCSRMTCPEVNCLNPVTPAGHCCPVCEAACVVDGREYSEGQSFPKPGDQCSQCTCMSGRVGCQSRPCPPVTCTHPATLPGDCCSSCSFCLFDRRIFRHMQRFILPNDSCQECRCHEGSVLCSQVTCPPLPCTNPMPMAGQCCPVCPKRCTVGGLSYEDGQQFRSPRDPCQQCLCTGGRVECQPRDCPPGNCQHPLVEDCCSLCDSCYYEGRVWKNGQTFKQEANRCRTCVCANGTVTCSRLQCDIPTCRNPVDDGCCPLCEGCSYGNRRYGNQEVFADPKDACRTCVCEDGSVTCHLQRCSPVTCRHPVSDGCCQLCTDCQYGGVTFRNGQEFPDLRDECGVCACAQGNVTCGPARCPPAQCSNPTMGTCCPECQNCNYEGQKVLEGESISHTSDPCQTCACRHGNMECRAKPCPVLQCRHPVQRDCCAQCSDCSYGGLEHRNGATFVSLEDECTECQCRQGNVECRPKLCPPATCSHPIRKGCCLECADCLYEDSIVQHGETVPDLEDACQDCRCVAGSVQCQSRPCPPAPCTHPTQGQCCLECGGDCDFQGETYVSGQTWERGCQQCRCEGGNVRCQPRACPPVTCTAPVTQDCCPLCTDCQVGGRRYRDGQSVPDPQDPCQECLCLKGSFACKRSDCPVLTCTHPGQGRCCPECRNCLMGELPLSHGQEVPDPLDSCNQCSCLFGNVTCARKACLPVPCSDPALDPCGCPSCTGCSFQGRELQDGQTLDHPSDGCKTCTCRRGRVSCYKRECRMDCEHPAGEVDCCPDCSDCLYEGKVRVQGLPFNSDVDPCQRCACRNGTVTCMTVDCPQPQCSQPVRMKGECCPSCPVCVFLGQEYEDDAEFQHPEDVCQKCTCKGGRVRCAKEECLVSCLHPRQDICCPKCDDCFFEGSLLTNGQAFSPDPCRQCRCRDGNVVCQETQCPTLDCIMKETPPGQCCPRCKGCNFRGVPKDNGAMWILEENACVSCTCVGGLVNCMETECVVPCLDPLPVPGQCCPVCPSCKFNGRTYNDGETFSPNGDPCDTCTCVDGQLRCVHQACPSVANCPPEQLLSPGPDQCCPACSGFGTNCTRANLGETFRPQRDPCLVCQCKDDFHWSCMRDPCPPVTCPPSVQATPPGQCCPQCPACYDSSDGRYHQEGDSWTAADDPCVSCVCQSDEIRCQVEECPVLQCGDMEDEVAVPGQCCRQCKPMALVGCLYQGIDRKPGAQWVVDECTRCACVGGEVRCSVQRCDLADCAPDETLSTAPGACCPVCVKQPGTCLVFGDPHYRTFDGTLLHLQGGCQYVMAKDCENDTFEVAVQHDRRGAPVDVSWAQNFTVSIGDVTVHLLQGNVVKVNGEVVELPFLRDTEVYLEQSGNSVLLSTNIGLKLLWDGDSYAELTVPGSYKRQLCGLCGNFNGYPQDDLRTRYGQITNSPAVFGNTWKASTQYSEACSDAQDIDPCITAGYRARKAAMTKCGILMGSDFTRCHRVVSPEPFLSSCVYDLCVCGDDPQCLCSILASYAHECAKAGVKVQWRKAGLCAIECSEERGFMFDECGPVCPRTCENLGTPLSQNCYKPCVAGCQCPANMVLHSDRCIPPSECPTLATLAP